MEAGKTLELTAEINREAKLVEATWQKDNKPIDRNAQGWRWMVKLRKSILQNAEHTFMHTDSKALT